MTSSISTLMSLCEKADNDIRACLNTLQVLYDSVLIIYPSHWSIKISMYIVKSNVQILGDHIEC